MEGGYEDVLIEELEAIRSLEVIAKEAEVIVKPELVSGKAIIVKHGPLQGIAGVIEKRKGKTLISVNIEILGQSVSAEVDAGDLEVDE